MSNDFPPNVIPIPATDGAVERRFYRPREAAEAIGSSIPFVMRAIWSGQLRAYQVGKAWFIPVEALDIWIRGEEAA